MKRIASPLFESTQMAQYSFWFVFGIAAMPACRRMYVFAATGRNGTACSNPPAKKHAALRRRLGAPKLQSIAP
jgi:hypothetical protein